MTNPFDELREFCEQNFEDIRRLVINGKQIEAPINAEQACEFLGISKSKLDRLVKGGQIPYHRPEGESVRFFYRSELNDWVRRRDFITMKKAS